MQMKVCRETVPLLLKCAAEQVESPVAGSDVEDKGLELHCWIVKEGEGEDVTVMTRGRKAVWRDAQQANPTLAPVLRWLEDGELPSRKELLQENPAIKALVEQWEMLQVQNSVLQWSWEDAVTYKCAWLLVVPLSLSAKLLK
ncbi:hypothetical protein E2C01_052661 [Portunus trituberculatus]|uniref:Uncharacterized protein n=1 Tax=Portunus trituberculatus TaxID=210409 RepID=A0A5B7GPZ6_PORTR|nr:hypothetical protein [Portunus trituberculatus]